MRTFLGLCVVAGTLALTASAQPFGAGVKLGGTLTDALSYKVPGPGSKSFVVGPYVELRLPAGFSLEADALYTSGLYSSIGQGGSTWQFPILAKYKFAKGILRPYLDGGVSFSHITDVPNIADLNHSSNFGIVAGAGLEIHAVFLRISPEVRYTGQFLKSIENPQGLYESNRNQAVILVGIGF
jgi:hypothetical protein